MSKSDDVKAAFGNGADATDVLAFTCDSTSKAHAIPAGWHGEFVRLRSVGAASFYFFSKLSSASCDETAAAAADGGASAVRGEYIPDGELLQVTVPYAQDGETVYLVRASTGTAVIYLTKASGTPGGNLKR